ncbi:hypothetical protein ACSNOH_25190 [Streptomyces sp. URMC 127]|uniref:hypothetical protein n=1 Tax=Streptomyces sp. URMC 127 TaxID=3423402 RepID=UPI003F1BE7DB
MTEAMTEATTPAPATAPPTAAAPEDAAPGPQPLGVARTPVGEPAVDAQLVRLADADHLAVSGHLEVYEDVHRGLRDALGALDRGPGPSGPPAFPGAPASHDNRS